MGKFYRKKRTKYIACPVIANPKAPTRAELTAGTPLGRIASVSGFTLSGATVATPDLDDNFVSNVPGDDTVSESSFTFWDDDEDSSIRDVLAKGTELFIVYLPTGDEPAKRCEVWHVTSLGVNDQVDLSAAAQFQVQFSVEERPEQNAVVPSKP